MNSSEYIERIENKIGILINEHAGLNSKLELSEQKIADLTLELTIARETIKNLENQIKINNIAKGNLKSEEEVREMRERLNEVIREVDRSIRYLKG